MPDVRLDPRRRFVHGLRVRLPRRHHAGTEAARLPQVRVYLRGMQYGRLCSMASLCSVVAFAIFPRVRYGHMATSNPSAAWKSPAPPPTCCMPRAVPRPTHLPGCLRGGTGAHDAQVHSKADGMMFLLHGVVAAVRPPRSQDSDPHRPRTEVQIDTRSRNLLHHPC